MDSIKEFLEIRIAEDEAAANAAIAAKLTYDYPKKTTGAEWRETDYGMVIGDSDLWDCEGSSTLCMAPSVAAHVARHDPRRVLTECGAKRAIIAMFKQDWSVNASYSVGVHDCIKSLAAVYADHPDYQQEWAPNG